MRVSGPAHAPSGGIVWTESRPSEGGRSAIVHLAADGMQRDLIAPEFNARTRVHEYGGGSWSFAAGGIVFSNFADQRLWRIALGAEGPEGEPQPLTPEPGEPAAVRFADGRPSPDGSRLICVREHHHDGAVDNEIVAVNLSSGEAAVQRSGSDFVSNPRPSPDGSRVCWLEWNHPQMPWEGTELWTAPIAADGSFGEPERLAGGPAESIWQPDWSPDSTLHFVSDRSGFWNLYREPAEALTAEQAELGYPHWVFGGSTYAFTDVGIAVIRVANATESLCRLDPAGGVPEPLELPFTSYSYPSLDAAGSEVLFAANAAGRPSAIVRCDLSDGSWEIVHQPDRESLEAGMVSVPRAIEFPTPGPDGAERTAHAFFYPPANSKFEGPDGELPPLIVSIHGGPSAHTTPEDSLEILYWTTRGIGVVDVNYGGSTGFGRAYRERLNGTWGIVDRDDCEAAAAYLAETGEADPERLAIHGGSAGGYTTLCALVFGNRFGAGASYYGVADAETLATDTHKFEARYLDNLIGPYPERADLYRERSPIHFVERISSPVIIFQGLEDEVVPPAQAEQIVAALKQGGIPHSYVTYAGEQHGFRIDENIIDCLERELAFYGQIFGFPPARFNCTSRSRARRRPVGVAASPPPAVSRYRTSISRPISPITSITSSHGIANSMPASAISTAASAIAAPVALRKTQGSSTSPPSGSQTRPSVPCWASATAWPTCAGVPPSISVAGARRHSGRRAGLGLAAAFGAGQRGAFRHHGADQPRRRERVDQALVVDCRARQPDR